MTVLNIANGLMVKETLQKNNIKGEIIAFNEAIVEGDVIGNVFSNEFIDYRCLALGVGREDYEEKTLKELEVLRKRDFNIINLWFDEDMFCQLNMVCLLAYIEQLEIEAEIILNLIDANVNITKKIKITLGSWYDLYRVVLEFKEKPNAKLPKIINEAIDNYLDLKNGTHEIITVIKERLNENPNIDEDILVEEMIDLYFDLGLGDVQYYKLIYQIKEGVFN